MRTTWNKLLDGIRNGDVIIAKAPANETVWNAEFNDGYGSEEGAPVCAWSETTVYFPLCYDGAEWIGRAPRHPQAEGIRHQGG